MADKHEKGVRSKLIWLIPAIIIVLLVIAGVAVYFSFFTSSTEEATLHVESGSVQVFRSNSWVSGTEGMQLKENDRIKTGDGEASVILYESIIIALEKNTEISLKQLSESNPSVKVESGSTWHKFTKLTGVEGYDVETPTTVATVRGTEFEVDYFPELDESQILVGEGTVDVSADGEKQQVSADEKITRSAKNKLQKSKLTPEEKAKVQAKILKNIERLKLLREREISKNKKLIDMARSQYKFTDQDIKDALADIDIGKLDDNELIAKSPVKTASIGKIKKINDEIKKQMNYAETAGVDKEKIINYVRGQLTDADSLRDKLNSTR